MSFSQGYVQIRTLFWSAPTTSFATQSADASSTSTGYAGSQRRPGDSASLRKLAEGGFNRVFLITLRDGFRMVARIPYPATAPKYFAVASEAATLAFLRAEGVPVPEVYGYSATPDNAAETEYIFMEFVDGTSLADVWDNWGEKNIISILRQLAQLEAKMMSIAFPAGGSLYFAEDLANTPGSAFGPGVALKDTHFCVGPETTLSLWYERRSQLDVDRRPRRIPPPF